MSSKNRPKVTPLSKLTRFRLALLCSFPAALFCSYYPLIHISESASTNYELSLSLIWLLFFSILSLKDALHYIYNAVRAFAKEHTLRASLPLLALLFPSYLTLTIFWSTNPLRAAMTSGILWCIYFSAIGFAKLVRLKVIDKEKFLKIFLLITCVFCGFCWLQSLLDIFGVDRSVTLLCSGCTSYSFGFPHPSGFAIEPQFMGNLLLAPTLLSLYLWVKSKSKKTIFDSKTLLVISFFILSTLFLTFSRGAIYSFALAFIFILLVNIIKQNNRLWLKTIPLVALSFIFTLLMQGLFSAASYTDSTFLGGIEKAISQMTLGKVELRLENPQYPRGDDVATFDDFLATDNSQSSATSDAPVFSGYVEESTNVRMNFNRIALELAPKNVKTLLFGYGLGSAGEVMYREGKTTTPFEIVQNDYLSLLLETGLIGLLLAILAFVVLAIICLKKLNRPERYLLEAIVISFLISLLFFSGLPNAVHIYLFPVFLAATLQIPSRQRLASRA